VPYKNMDFIHRQWSVYKRIVQLNLWFKKVIWQLYLFPYYL
jgi:hypothetical protein